MVKRASRTAIDEGHGGRSHKRSPKWGGWSTAKDLMEPIRVANAPHRGRDATQGTRSGPTTDVRETASGGNEDQKP